MKARKFWKRVLTIRGLVIALLVIVIGVFAIAYFGFTIKAHTIEIDNMEFSFDGFTDFNSVDESNMNEDKKVAENDKYVLFIDEKTTILTVAVKSSLISGEDANKSSSYKTVYSTANKNGTNEQKANFNLFYTSSSITDIYSDTIDSYQYSVKFENELTGEAERHYEIKYLTKDTDSRDAVQVYYTIGNFGSIKAFFPTRLYTTIYAPDRFAYDSEESYNQAVEEYNNDYLSQVGSLSNTFEEKFRGNVAINTKAKTISNATVDGTTKTIAIPEVQSKITVYSQEARDYLIFTAFKELNKKLNEEDGVTNEEDWYDYYPIYTEDDLEELNESAKTDNYGNHSWEFTINDPELRLITFGTEEYKKYFNNSDSPLTNNPFILYTHYVNFMLDNYKTYDADEYDFSGSMQYYNAFRQSSISSGTAKYMYPLFYGSEISRTSITSGNYMYTGSEEEGYTPYVSGGFVERDENGNFVYDEDGNVKRTYYTTELVTEDNTLFGTTSTGLPLFKIALDFELTSEGLNVTIPQKSLIDSSTVDTNDPNMEKFNVPYYIASVQLLTNMAYAPDTSSGVNEEGYMIVPDGSGAVINFNNGKNDSVTASYYGSDQAYVKGTDTEEPANLMLGMFAFVRTTTGNEGGLLGIIEKGGGQISLTATTNKKNSIYFSAKLRSSENIKTGTVTDNRSFPKYDKILSPSDIAVKYVILDKDQTDYSTIAKIYQNYLINRDNLSSKDTTNQTVTDLTFLGTYEKYALFLGIKYKTPDTLTTFEQAEEIIDELQDNNVTNISVNYKGWTSEYLEYEVGGSLKVANVLGKTASIRKFYEYCVEKGVPFYPEIYITSTKGYDYIAGSSRYSTRGVGNDEAVHYSYNLATKLQEKKQSKTYTIAPQYYKDIANKILKQLNGINITKNSTNKDYNGVYLVDLGNQYAGNYRNKKQVYAAESISYQQEVMNSFTEYGNVKLSAPYDYAFKYVTTAVNVPINSKMYTVYDYSIPFYQLVVSGLFDYTTEQINGQTSKPSQWYFIKALESGSNLSYIISAEDPKVLLDTDYTQYYQAYYKNWKDTIIKFTNEMNSLGIQECTLTNHELISDNVVRVTYTNKTNGSKIVLVLNLSGTTKTHGGNKIAAYSYIKEA